MFGGRPVEREEDMERHGEKRATQSPGEIREHTLPSQPSEGANPAYMLILDFQLSALGVNTFLLFKLLSLWHVVTAATANSYRT